LAGIYIHIPFCRKKCFYCDFYKTTAVTQKPLFLKSLLQETSLRQDYLKGETVETIYLGGGTPSVLTAMELSNILTNLKTKFQVSEKAEITLEANPDDLSPKFLGELLQIGFNRLSIGIQSFSDDDLRRMNRRHTSQQALQVVYDAIGEGFSEISIDLIYGLPGLTMEQWQANLETALHLPVNHLSAYHLTYHEGTKFYEWLKKGQLVELPEDDSVAQFEMLMDKTLEAGFEQYEISNFARESAYSKHNSSYWKDHTYLGLGPSAHSYDGVSRQWNVADLYKYILALEDGRLNCEQEILTETERANDYLITRIRTKWGISIHYLENEFGEKLRRKVEQAAQPFIYNGQLQQNGDTISLTRSGIMLSDKIMLALMV
jgi:oxygen-independent coproporphyrinogen III oxidase